MRSEEFAAVVCDLRIETGGTESVALRRMRVGVVRAVLVTGDGGARVHVAPRDELMGVGLRASLGGDTALRIEPVGERAYLHYLFPGMVVWTLLVNGLLGMGTSMAHYRNTRFLKKLRKCFYPQLQSVKIVKLKIFKMP